MSQPDVLTNGSFLPPAYAAQAETLTAMSEMLEPSPDSGVPVNAQITECIIKMSRRLNQHSRFVDAESKKLRRYPMETERGRERLLQLLGMTNMFVDGSMRVSVELASIVTGDLEANHPDDAPTGYEVGEEIIMARACHTASTLLRAADTIYREYADAPSGWDRANAVHRSGRAKAGPKIKKGELAQFDELCAAAFETPIKEAPALPIKPSRFTAVTMFRAVRAARAEVKARHSGDSSVTLLEKAREMTEISTSGQPTPLELTPAQIVEVMGTATKILKYVRNAARVDEALAADPSVRYFSFSMSKLAGGYAIGSEMAAYKRRATQTAAQLKQFA